PVLLQGADGATVKEITHRPDGGMLGSTGSAVASWDGTLSVRSYPEPEAPSMAGYPSYLSFYSKTGEAISSFRMPPWTTGSPVAFDGKHVLVWVSHDPIWAKRTEPDDLICLDMQGHALWRTTVDFAPGYGSHEVMKFARDCSAIAIVSATE